MAFRKGGHTTLRLGITTTTKDVPATATKNVQCRANPTAGKIRNTAQGQ